MAESFQTFFLATLKKSHTSFHVMNALPTAAEVKTWVSVKVRETETSTAWALLPPGAKLISARPEGTKWGIGYELNGVRKSHFAGVQFTQSKNQIKNLFAIR